MSFDWQTCVALAVVAAAIAYLARGAWQSMARRRAAACGGCGHCPAGTSGGSPDVVEIQAIARQPHEEPGAVR